MQRHATSNQTLSLCRFSIFGMRLFCRYRMRSLGQRWPISSIRSMFCWCSATSSSVASRPSLCSALCGVCGVLGCVVRRATKAASSAKAQQTVAIAALGLLDQNRALHTLTLRIMFSVIRPMIAVRVSCREVRTRWKLLRLQRSITRACIPYARRTIRSQRDQNETNPEP